VRYSPHVLEWRLKSSGSFAWHSSQYALKKTALPAFTPGTMRERGSCGSGASSASPAQYDSQRNVACELPSSGYADGGSSARAVVRVETTLAASTRTRPSSSSILQLSKRL
jgi:hypothetical protein